MAEETKEEKKEEEEVPPEALPEVKEKTPLEAWVPKTSLGKQVFEGKITDIEQILSEGKKITEPEIVDKLLPDLKTELIFIGGRRGKGGGVQRIPVKITATMHKSGRRFRTKAFVVVGNEDGIVGIGKASALEARDAIEKATRKAKMNIIKIKRGCGSFECGCNTNHSIPYRVEGKSGSVRVVLMPAPKGVGLVANDEAKKILRLAGIKDAWLKSYGNTGMRQNLVSAIFDAFKKLYVYEKAEE